MGWDLDEIDNCMYTCWYLLYLIVKLSPNFSWANVDFNINPPQPQKSSNLAMKKQIKYPMTVFILYYIFRGILSQVIIRQLIYFCQRNEFSWQLWIFITLMNFHHSKEFVQSQSWTLSQCLILIMINFPHNVDFSTVDEFSS